MYVFISHSSTDATIAQDICGILEATGVECFLAPRNIRSGYEYASEIVNGLDKSDILLLLLSSRANQSPHVLREIERAVTNSTPIIVYKLEEVELTKSMEYFLMTHQWLNAEKGDYTNLLRSVQAFRGNEESTTTDTAPTAPTTPVRPVSVTKKSQASVLPWVAFASIIIALGIIIGILLNNGNSNSTQHPDSDSYAEIVSPNNTSSTNNTNATSDTTTNEVASTENSTTVNNDNISISDIKLGDTIIMGKYNDADIYWRVLKISDDGTEAIVVSRDILSFKAYDAPESGTYNNDGQEFFYSSDSVAETDMELQAFIRGNSIWEASSIRTWLNSADEIVKYEGQAPVASAMADGANGYNSEKGFLCGFTDEELASIKDTKIKTKGNALNDGQNIETIDKIFLLSMDELAWFEEANISTLAEPTPEAIEKNGTYWYKDYCVDYGLTTAMWWLREPVTDKSALCYLVGNGYYEENIYTWEVGVESFGIRPAMTIDLTFGNFKRD